MTTPPRCTDPVAWPVAEAMLAALEVVYAEQAEHDETLVLPCEYEILPGAIPVLDHGLACEEKCEGMAWVRIADTNPTDAANFPGPIAREVRGELSYSVQIEVGVARCAPVGRTEGDLYYPPTAAEQREAARKAAVDAAIVRHVILDRFPKDNEQLEGVALGSYAPLGPEGDVVGGSTLCFVFVP